MIEVFGGYFSGAGTHREKQDKYAGNRKTIPVSFDNAHRFQKRKNWKRSYLCAKISKGV